MISGEAWQDFSTLLKAVDALEEKLAELGA